MKITIKTTELLRCLNSIMTVIKKSPINPLTEDVKIEVSGSTMKLIGTSIQNSVISSMDIIPELGSADKTICVSAATLHDTIKLIDDEYIKVTSDDSHFMIASKSGKFKMKQDNTEDFPEISELPGKDQIIFESDQILEAIENAFMASSSDISRPALNGISIKSDKSNFKIAGTDGYKLTLTTIPNNTSKEVDFIIQKEAVSILRKLSKSSQVTIKFSDSKIEIDLGKDKLISSKLDLTYPKYESLIPIRDNEPISIDTKDFLKSINRTFIYGDHSYPKLKLNFKKDLVEITSENNNFNYRSKEKLTCDFDSPADSEILVNPKIMSQMLSLVKQETCCIRLARSADPILITGKDEPNLLILIMPINE